MSKSRKYFGQLISGLGFNKNIKNDLVIKFSSFVFGFAYFEKYKKL